MKLFMKISKVIICLLIVFSFQACDNASSESSNNAIFEMTKSTGNNLTVYFKKPANWGQPKIYAWLDNNGQITKLLGNWSGKDMLLASEEGDDWYKYTIEGYTACNLIFNDGNNQTNDLYRDRTGYYKDNNWTNGNPENQKPVITVSPQGQEFSVNTFLVRMQIASNTQVTDRKVQLTINNNPAIEEVLASNDETIDLTDYMNIDDTLKLQVFATNSDGETISSVETYNRVEQPEGITVYFKKPVDWGAPKIYAWIIENGEIIKILGEWSGKNMHSAPEEGTDWYKYTVEGYASFNLIFNDGNNQTDDLTRSKKGFYKDNNWTNTNPEIKTPEITISPAGQSFNQSPFNVSINISSVTEVLERTATIIVNSNTPIVENLSSNNETINLANYMSLGDTLKLQVSASNNKGETLSGTETYTWQDQVTTLGAVYSKTKTTFSIWSPDSNNVKVAVNGTDYTCSKVADFEGYTDVYSVTVSGDLHLAEYQFKINNIPVRDPYGVMVKYGTGVQETIEENGVNVTSDCGLNTNIVVDLSKTEPEQGWALTPELKEREDAIVYEVNVRDFTIDSTSGVSANKRGKYMGMVETGTKYGSYKTGIDHLKELGVTHVQLMPVYDSATRYNHDTGQDYNWGYDPVNFNIPEDRFASNPADYVNRIKEFKEMVNEYHKNGIRVIMDVVYNHTFRDEMFENITNKYYDGKNLSGCGNSIDAHEYMVKRFIQDSLEYWAREYNIDGFRFDLFGIIDHQAVKEWGEHLNNLYPEKNLLIYGEPWCGAGGGDNDDSNVDRKVRLGKMPLLASAHVGAFNDRFRQALKGSDDNGGGTYNAYIFNTMMEYNNDGFDSRNIEYGVKGSITEYYTTSAFNELWVDRFAADPEQAINYVSAHDNLCLWDKIIKAGKTGDYAKAIDKFATGILLTSQGIPFIHAGDEMLRTKYNGDWDRAHNSYMWGDRENKIKWNWKSDNINVFNYYKAIIDIRKNHPGFRMNTYQEVSDNVSTYRDWGGKVIITTINGSANNDSWDQIKVIYNSATDYQFTESGWTKAFGEGVANTCKGTAVTIYYRNN